MFDKSTLSVEFFVTHTLSIGFSVIIEDPNLPEWEWASFEWPLKPGENIQAAWIDLLKEIGETYGIDDDGLTDCDDGTDEYCHEIDYDCDGESDADYDGFASPGSHRRGDCDCPHTPNQWDRCPLNCDIDMPF